MRQARLFILIALMTIQSHLLGLWAPAAVLSAAANIGSTLFPFFMATKLASKDTATHHTAVHDSPGSVVNHYTNCTFNHSPVSSGNIGSDAYATMMERMQNVGKNLEEKRRTIVYVFLSVLAGVYLYTNFVLYQLNDAFLTADGWSWWKREVSLDHLKEMPSDRLVDEIQQSARVRHTTVQGYVLLDAIIQEMENEIAVIEAYESIVYYIDCVLVPEQCIMARFRDGAVGFSGYNEQATETIHTIFTWLTLKNLFLIDYAFLEQYPVIKERLLFFKCLLEAKRRVR